MKYWRKNSPVDTFFYDGFSILFPAWELVFVEVARHHRSNITDADLIAKINAFITQETAHSKAHSAHNKRTHTSGLEHEEFLRTAKVIKRPQTKILLGAMVSIEHLAAVISRRILSTFDANAGREHKLFRWHAVEELSHKDLAMELWLSNRYTVEDLRPIAFKNFKYVTKTIFSYVIDKLRREKLLWKPATLYSLCRLGVEFFLFVVLPYISIFTPKFHPNNTNDFMYLGVTNETQ